MTEDDSLPQSCGEMAPGELSEKVSLLSPAQFRLMVKLQRKYLLLRCQSGRYMPFLQIKMDTTRTIVVATQHLEAGITTSGD
jgi:hypothetical protein